jgi:lipopolysaccharide biosynthesis regulator YciM
MNKSIRKHRENMKKERNNLKSTPKEYWKIINTGIKQNNPDIPIDVFLDFFKTTNECWYSR